MHLHYIVGVLIPSFSLIKCLYSLTPHMRSFCVGLSRGLVHYLNKRPILAPQI